MEKEIEWIDTVEALEIFKKSKIVKRGRYKPNRPTLLKWVEKYSLGRKFAGRYEIDKQKFIDFLNTGGYKNNG